MPIKGSVENLDNLLGMVEITRFIRVTDGVESRTVEVVRTMTCEIKKRERWSRPSKEEQRRKSDLFTVFVLSDKFISALKILSLSPHIQGHSRKFLTTGNIKEADPNMACRLMDQLEHSATEVSVCSVFLPTLFSLPWIQLFQNNLSAAPAPHVTTTSASPSTTFNYFLV